MLSTGIYWHQRIATKTRIVILFSILRGIEEFRYTWGKYIGYDRVLFHNKEFIHVELHLCQLSVETPKTKWKINFINEYVVTLAYVFQLCLFKTHFVRPLFALNAIRRRSLDCLRHTTSTIDEQWPFTLPYHVRNDIMELNDRGGNQMSLGRDVLVTHRVRAVPQLKIPRPDTRGERKVWRKRIS